MMLSGALLEAYLDLCRQVRDTHDLDAQWALRVLARDIQTGGDVDAALDRLAAWTRVERVRSEWRKEHGSHTAISTPRV